jgi:hypothetical protein
MMTEQYPSGDVEIDGLLDDVIDGCWLVMEHAQENWQKKLDDDRAISKWGC